ncbi:uncharacterized protein Z519_11977 [Cladophialophora bantiana CBS 173.52]|uniref:Uncharacterized protein n=1 Tax=Cladophialophora bantiana (strain ATCC 10958 / CBS 173.52 / CDC B-1940 / NIH 8579) TaxID=1442370 RepID=A0A0D2EB20_CLAB1|nr:uncharacterized protein Z519_11977 [Cladophialophora bantiana CBS 173.52]KIW87341.1 hypothetical protein Z519_11977 [Cladophialophora bantiana CBS 173.52]
MGFSSRRPILPAPTDSLLESADDTGHGTDLGTDLSRRSEKTSEIIPDDGSPITITPAPKRNIGKLTKSGQQSQTSLLIELFEGGKASDSGQRRPSLRVRYTPSHSRKNRDKSDRHILVTESPTARRPSFSHRISLGGNETLAPNVIEGSISSLDTGDDFRPAVPVDIEVLQNEDSDRSVLSSLPETRYIIPESDISSMPAESSLGPNPPINMSPSSQSVSITRGMSAEGASLKPPVIPAERNLSNERITQKVIEKLSNKPRVSSNGKRHHSSHSGSRSSATREPESMHAEPRIRVTKNVDDDSMQSMTGSSIVSGSQMSADPRATDQRSARSGTSNVSVTNNPKLLHAVEDAIRRLILPELNELRRDQKHSHRSRHDKYSNPDVSSSTLSREDRTRRRSSGGKSKRRVSREAEGGMPSDSSRRHRRHKTVDYDSPSEQSYEPSESVDSLGDEKRSRRHSKGRRARDVAAGSVGGAALTAAALKSHDSASSLDYSEHRRRRRSKSRSSRSASYTEKEDAFQKHQVPPMPFVSEIGTDLTRSSLKSSNDGRAETPTRREVREVIRGSPLELSSPASQTTPTANALDLKRGLGTHHGNFSEHDLSTHDLSSKKEMFDEDTFDKPHEPEELDFATHGFAALTDPERARQYERNLHQQHPIRRGLSPIQSVASYATTEPNRNSLMQAHSSESLHSPGKHPEMDDQVSVSSLSSAPSTDLARSRRPQGMSLESRSEVMAQHVSSLESTPRQMDPHAAFGEHHEDDSYRDSPYIDKVTAGQQVVAKGIGATAQYVDEPSGVESAVASLVEPSLLSADYTYSPRHSQTDSLGAHEMASPLLSHNDYMSRHSGSPLKRQLSNHSESLHGLAPGAAAVMTSPPQSPARSLEHLEQASAKSAHPAPLATSNVPSGQVERSPESDITTNPSIIRGPIGGLTQGNTEHWPYDPTPPHSRANLVLPPVSRDIGSAGADLIPEPLSTNRDHDFDPKRDLYLQPQPLSTPPGAKDEGYETGANVPSPGLYSQGRGVQDDTFTPDIPLDHSPIADDPFTAQRDQYVSGLSHGMSPMYDSATGRGRDNIQSKDIVALMDHLTMRDAQRNARDTEILVTLVRSAAEMRNSFEDMKKFIAEQDDLIMDTADRQHERTQKIIGGPRPQPIAAPRPTMSATSEEDMPSKRRNVFQRALRGLGAKNSLELQNIEAMLMRLLDEVEALRASQPRAVARDQPRSTSLTSAENTRAPTDTGYEPEGQAGTSSTGDRSGYFSNNSSRQADYRNHNMRRDSGNRVSTVMEGDEEYDDYGNHLGAAGGNAQVVSHTPLGTPPRNDGIRQARGGSVPLNTPPRTLAQNTGSLSNENTPHLSAGDASGRKHKSFASSFIPKMVSRWSKTTSSSADNFRSSQQRVRPYSEHSRSGSNLGEYEYEHDPQGEDRIRSNTSFNRDQYEDVENRPPSPLVPSQLSDNPKYQAHRNSINLQHPQPRQGPTGRFQSRLESEAQHYNNEQISPTSQTSSQWETHLGLHPTHAATISYGGHLSPISDSPYSAEPGQIHDSRSIQSGSSQGPPRPPKIPNDEPLVPQRPPKIMMSPTPSNRQPTYVDHVAAARAGSPAFDKSPVAALRSPQSQARKPSGPRPLGGSGGSKGDLNAIKRARFRGSPNQIDSEDEATAAH